MGWDNSVLLRASGILWLMSMLQKSLLFLFRAKRVLVGTVKAHAIAKEHAIDVDMPVLDTI